MSIQDENSRLEHYFFYTASFLFTGYWPWNPELYRITKAPWIIIDFLSIIMVSQ